VLLFDVPHMNLMCILCLRVFIAQIFSALKSEHMHMQWSAAAGPWCSNLAVAFL